jgi:formamidopyrimidine-DNA glycosylase
VIFHLDQGDLFFNDQRLFGWVIIDSTFNIDHLPFIKNLGPEPFEIDKDKFLKILSPLKKPIKLALMDQTVISGVGNIYANDACWEAKVNPRRLANTLTRKQYEDLYTGLVKVLKEGIKYGGATAADAKYIDLHGLGGHYQDHFRTYDREGEECLREDGGIIHKFSLGGRGTYMCPKCQE